MGFVRTVNVDLLLAGTIGELQVEGKALAVAHVGGEFYAVNNTCVHRGGPLGQGALDGKLVTCPWHGWQFDVTNGHSLKKLRSRCGLLSSRGARRGPFCRCGDLSPKKQHACPMRETKDLSQKR
jgi:nitrite reductase/ring-hydroxylating ferredoxin subunit